MSCSYLGLCANSLPTTRSLVMPGCARDGEPARESSSVPQGMIIMMGKLRRLAVAMIVAGAACAPGPSHVVIVGSGAKAISVADKTKSARELILSTGDQIQAGDLVLANGMPIDPDQPIGASTSSTLQVVPPRHVNINGKQFTAAARTVGDAVSQAGFRVYVADSLSPPAEASLKDGMSITLTPADAVSADVDGTRLEFRSAAGSLGQALANAGLPLQDIDRALPGEQQPLDHSASIQIHRLTETLDLRQAAIPFESQTVDAADLALGQEVLRQVGSPGLTVTRARIQYAGNHEVSHLEEPPVVVRAPVARIVARGTAVEENSTTVAGTSIQYWHVMQMYATVYSPCNSGSGGCSYGTASGLKAGKGVVAVDPSLYAQLGGQRLFIPGYGYAVIGDVGGGYIVEQNLGISRYKWIDLGFDDDNIQDMTGWVTVYFLSPAPPTIPEILK
jgi:uncharacterized protein YabE (DUF348 family)